MSIGFALYSLTAYGKEETRQMMGNKDMMMKSGSMKEQHTIMEHTSMMETETIEAKAQLRNNKGIEIGNVMFTQKDNGVEINVEVNNMPQGVYAFHIHENGLCDTPDYKSCGGHFNPFGKKHGFLNQEGPHAGDLPNIEVNSNGKGYMRVMTSRMTLRKGEMNSLFKEGGTAVILHQGPDDYISDPAGHGGARIACGIIEEMN